MSPLSTFLVAGLLAAQSYAVPSTSERRQASGVPSFVTEFAPIVFLHSQEVYFPSDLATHVANTLPQVNFEVVSGAPNPLTLDNLDALNDLGGSSVYLTSIDSTLSTPEPAWLRGTKPNADGLTEGATSCAIIVNDYGNGTVIAFYMYFYSYNWGGLVLGLNFDDHVGDWEHSAIVFENGVPQTMWFSIHEDGEAFEFSVVPKFDGGNRPIVFSANGSHANYATSGTHDHTIPGIDLPIGIFLVDHTDQTTMWDPTLNAYYASVSFPDGTTPVFAAFDDTTPINWLNFIGQWGDEQYPTSTPGQFDLFGQFRYTSGPTGPEDKDLNRGQSPCPSGLPDPCIILPFVLPGQ